MLSMVTGPSDVDSTGTKRGGARIYDRPSGADRPGLSRSRGPMIAFVVAIALILAVLFAMRAMG